MAREFNVAIVGATGLVGQTMATVLKERRFPVKRMRFLASARSASLSLDWHGEAVPVEETAESSFAGVDIVLMSAGAEQSRQFAPAAAQAGAVVIDNSAAWRMEPEVPLVVPEVNPDDAQHHHGIIANPNCSTIQMVVALFPLHQVNPIRTIVVDTYQSVSGTGSAAVDELREQAHALLEQPAQSPMPSVYPYQIAFNVLPHIDSFETNGYSREELKMLNETRKIMHAPTINVSATTVRVPVFFAHSEAVHVEFTHPMSPEEAREILAKAPGVVVQDNPAALMYPMPVTAAGRDEVFVGRIRRSLAYPNSLHMWIVSDNIRKGAATNAVQIAELMVEKGWL